MNNQTITDVPLSGLRIDKWLWAVRFFKTRALAAHACELGRIHFHEQPAKPSREVHPGDVIRIRNDSGDYSVEVLALSAMRGPAAVAQALYRESEESRQLRLKAAEDRKAMSAAGAWPAAKPSKRDRREIDRFRGRTR